LLVPWKGEVEVEVGGGGGEVEGDAGVGARSEDDNCAIACCRGKTVDIHMIDGTETINNMKGIQEYDTDS